MKKIWSLLLCVVMLLVSLPVIPAGVAAADTGGDGDGLSVQDYTYSVSDYTYSVSDYTYLPQTPQDYQDSLYTALARRLAAGSSHAAAVLEEGTVEIWGSSSAGALEVAAEATAVKALAAGGNFTLALREDGALAGWGSNRYGQCDAPDELNGKTVKSMAVYNYSAAALTADNKIVVWGNYVDTAEVVTGSKPLVAIALNSNCLLALADDGTVEAWSWRNGISAAAVPAGFSGDVVAITDGDSHALALKADGSVVSWGNDAYPVPAGLTDVRAVAAGGGYSAALDRDGTVTVWGEDRYNLLAVPAGLGPVAAIAVGSYDIFALRFDGTVASWGRNSNGIGDVPEDLDLFSPVSTNDRLTGLNVETSAGGPCNIFPQFGCEQTEGIVDVPYDAGTVRVTADPYSSAAVLEIDGRTIAAGETVVLDGGALQVGDNPVEITVTAASGSQRGYTLHIKRVSAGYALPGLPQTPQAYQASQYAVQARKLAVGEHHVLAVKDNGTVVAWGQGNNGACNIPAGLNDVAAVAAGDSHSLALRADGTVAAWGSNYSGERNVPSGLAGIADIAACGSSSMALDQSGEVYAWGQNDYGQCNIPGSLGDDIVDIQCGSTHGLALRSDGTVAAWGNNSVGQCNVPSGLNRVVAIAAGFQYSAALRDDGALVIWGVEDSQYKIQDPGLRYVKGIAAAKSGYLAALKWDGSVAVLGPADYGTQYRLGVPLEPDREILALGCAGGSSDGILVALDESGAVTSWGDTLYSMREVPAGLNLFEADAPPYGGAGPDMPRDPTGYAAGGYARAAAKVCSISGGVAVLNMDGTVRTAVTGATGIQDLTVPAGLDQVTDIASGSRILMALRADGTVAVWGYNGDRQCEVPADLGRVTAIAASEGFNSPYCLALREDGMVAAWGGDAYGHLNVPAGLAGVTAIAAGDKHCLALKADGTVAAWGDNARKECDVPAGLSDVARIYAGNEFSLALKADGTVVAWGSNLDSSGTYDCGQCDVPAGLSGVVDIKVSDTTCIALKNDGTVAVWGNNQWGRRNVPPGLHDVVAIGGMGGVMAVKSDGTVAYWAQQAAYQKELLSGLRHVLTVSGQTIIFTDGALQYCNGNINESIAQQAALINGALAGLNVLSGHYFDIASVELLDPSGHGVGGVPAGGGYRLQARVENNFTAAAPGLVILQVRGGEGAAAGSGGRVLGCVGLSGAIPVSGSTFASDFTMPAGAGGKAYVDVFVWDGWDTMIPRAAASQAVSFDITQ